MSNPKNLQLSEQDITEILLSWSLNTPLVKPTNQGTVNTTFFVEAPKLGKFVFKIYDDWTGWFLEKKVTYQSVVDGVVKMLLLEDWLQEHIIGLA